MLPLFILTTIIFAFVAIFFAYQLDVREEKDKHQEEMNLFMIHELRSPLSSVKAASSLLINKASTLDDKTKGTMFTLINTQSIRLLEYISILLDTARYESGTFTLQSKPNDIKTLLTERIELLQPLAVEKNIHVELKVIQPIPSFRFDKEYISHVVDNLLYNALKFTPKDGSITVYTDLKHTFVEVKVENSGVHLTQEQQRTLFSKFAPMSHTNTTTKGTGLGLYFVKGIVEAHGGSVGVHSTGDITSIYFSLPFIPAPITS